MYFFLKSIFQFSPKSDGKKKKKKKKKKKLQERKLEHLKFP